MFMFGRKRTCWTATIIGIGIDSVIVWLGSSAQLGAAAP